jgi:TPR repeat protein
MAEAEKWWRSAAALGDQGAQKKLAELRH